jgi:glutathione synthase/RimK-type ligase-like ATP-grasp enzyme
MAAVERILKRDKVPHAYLDQRAILDSDLTLNCGETIGGTLRVSGEEIRLEDVKAVYPRPYDWELLKPIADAGPQSPEFLHANSFQQTLSIWLDLTPALVLNRPHEMALNYSKPYQAAMIEAAGFAIPETLLTTDSAAVRDFRRTHGAVIYKSVSCVRSIVSQLRPEDETRLENVSWCPTQFQRRITGPEVRAHVVGGEVFASEIVSKADDYRYAALSGDSLEIRSYDLPADCAARCRAVADTMRFLIAGVDLRYENGTWYCFEVNPSPGFMYYQEQTGQPIDEAVARLLAAACQNS